MTIDQLKEWCLHAIKLTSDADSRFALLLKDKYNELILQAYESNDMRGMRMLYTDCKELTRDLNKESKSALNELLLKYK